MLDFAESLVRGVGQTVSITACAFLIGAVLGFPLALLRRSRNVLVRWGAALVIDTVRSIPPIVVVFLVFYSVGSGAVRLGTFQAAVIGLGAISAAYLAEIYRAGIESVASGQWEAANALALPSRKMYVHVILPQALLVAIPPAATFAIGLLKDSAVASVIGAQDITFFAFQESQATLQGLTIFLVAAVLYIALSLPVAGLARWSDHALSKRVAT
ncbi:amino acid ABC transporter permease [Ornithinimicrobium cavernae]|uniref:amino acid ABC transporter permease n=1 Tax=Ornithinimicrobium cavernae TaxID=2666047 RepID=UPI000D691248|nr:amino acid ABC transporter permease [Ornithinimicrobium cavernae]